MITLYDAVNVFTVSVVFSFSQFTTHILAFTGFRSREQMILIQSQNAVWQRTGILEITIYLTS